MSSTQNVYRDTQQVTILEVFEPADAAPSREAVKERAAV